MTCVQLRTTARVSFGEDSPDRKCIVYGVLDVWVDQGYLIRVYLCSAQHKIQRILAQWIRIDEIEGYKHSSPYQRMCSNGGIWRFLKTINHASRRDTSRSGCERKRNGHGGIKERKESWR